MSAIKCDSLRDSLRTHLLESTITEKVGDACVVTLPMPTIDGRIVSAFVESRAADYFLVHDGGKAVNELILQGVKITDSIEDHFEALAQSFGASYTDEMFQAIGKQPDLQKMILAIGACSGIAMAQLVGHIATATQEPLREQFGRALRVWGKKKVKVANEVPVRGRHAQHKFDFVAYPRTGRGEPIAMSVLSPRGNPLATAQRFGFKATDLDSTPFEKWPRVAVEDRAELWSAEAKNIVRNCAHLVIEIPSDSRIDAHMIGEHLRPLA